MRIVFAPSTTITEANALRLEHDLQLQPTSYVSDDGRHFVYRYADDRHYASYARFYWSDTEHDSCSVATDAAKPCPAIEPRYGYYSPVSSRVADQLRQDPHVAHVDNYNNPAYFVRWMIRGVIQTVSHRWAEMTNVAFHPAA